MLPLEFTVLGPPVSHQTKNKVKLTEWKQYVRTWASLHWGIGPPTKVAVEVSVTYFHEGDTVLLDNDNMLKPIQDAMNGLVYEDDRLVTLVHVKKARIRSSFSLQGCSKLVLDGLFEGRPFIHIRVDEASSQGELPR